MKENFPQQPVPVAHTIKQLHDQVQACKQWISATAAHTVTIIFFARVNGFDTTNLVKIDEQMIGDLSPGTREHLDKFFQALADEQWSKKLMLENQQALKGLKTFNASLKNFTDGKEQ